MIRINAIKVGEFMLGNCMAHGRGRSSLISRSKSRKVISTRKNFMENGSQAELMGSNPHSCELNFSVYIFRWDSQRLQRLGLWIG